MYVLLSHAIAEQESYIRTIAPIRSSRYDCAGSSRTEPTKSYTNLTMLNTKHTETYCTIMLKASQLLFLTLLFYLH